MGKFDGFLLASDWDGTLFYKGAIPEENLKAIRYFQDNGGLFTVCSGRFHNFLKGFSSAINFNTYVSCCNGALIMDLNTEEVLYQGFCDNSLFDIIVKLFEKGIGIKSVMFFAEGLEYTPEVHSEEELRELFPSLILRGIYKVYVTHNTEYDAIANKDAIEDICQGYGYITIRSCAPGLEITKKENSKGAAIKRIADKIGAKYVVTVGDYENDIDLIKAADVGYAVDNAIDSLKMIADRITVHCKDGAIARIIEDLDLVF
jgi:Cof subfamily protein (haloacid dehalogenase superfamily)